MRASCPTQCDPRTFDHRHKLASPLRRLTVAERNACPSARDPAEDLADFVVKQDAQYRLPSFNRLGPFGVGDVDEPLNGGRHHQE